MRAAVLTGINEAVTVQNVPELTPAPGEAIVKIAAAALNHRDVWIRKGMYAGLKFPVVLGADGVGTVTQVGEGVTNDWLGQKVIIDPSLFWGDSERYQSPKTFQILGLPRDGTFAEFVAVPASNLHKKPDYLTTQEAAAIPLAGTTAHRAVVSRGGLQAGESVLITGCGSGSATLALQMAVALGANVYVSSSSPDKIAKAVAMGAKAGVNYKKEDWHNQLKVQAGGFDLVVDSAGGEGFAHLINLAKPGGRIVFFGATTGNPSTIDLRKIFWKQLSLLGTTMGSPADFQAMLDLFAKHEIRPVIDCVFPLNDVDEALNLMQSGAQMGKIVVEVGNLE